MTWRQWGKRLGVSAGAGIAVALLTAVILALVDIYVTGHGHVSIMSPWVDLDWAGIHLSLADVVLLTVTALTIALTFRALGRDS